MEHLDAPVGGMDAAQLQHGTGGVAVVAVGERRVADEVAHEGTSLTGAAPR